MKAVEITNSMKLTEIRDSNLISEPIVAKDIQEMNEENITILNVQKYHDIKKI